MDLSSPRYLLTEPWVGYRFQLPKRALTTKRPVAASPSRSGSSPAPDGATSQAERQGPDAVLARPVNRLAERGRDDAFGEQALFKTRIINAREQVRWPAG